MSTKVKFLWALFLVLTIPFTTAAQASLLSWETLLELVSKHPNIQVGKYYLHRTPSYSHLPEHKRCIGHIVIPKENNLQDLLGITYAQLIEAGHNGGLSVDYLGGKTTYSFDVPMSYCDKGSGSGGAAAQFSFNHTMWLIIFAILAFLAIGLLKRRNQSETVEI